MREYRAARVMVWVLSALGWLTVIAAIALPVYAQIRGTFPVDILRLAGFAALGILVGLAQVALAQIVAAQIDTARNTAELVTLLRRDRAADPAHRPVNHPGAPLPAEPPLSAPGRREPTLTRS